MSNLFLLGLNHTIAPVEVRERLAFAAERLTTALTGLRGLLVADACACDDNPPEVVILSTCNRTEVYVWAAGDATGAVRRFLAERSGLDAEMLATYLYARCGDDAGHHLLRVAAGLDSLVIGENEILGQVKAAYEAAHAAGTTGPVLSALFRFAVQAGKRVRSETEIGRLALSVGTIVVEMAQDLFGSLADRTALLIGAGKMGSIAGQALVRAGLRCVLVANRTYDRAERLAAALGGRAVRFDALVENLAAADIVICSTGAPHLVLHADDVRRALQLRPQPPAPGPRLLIVDLAVPRDADPAIAAIPGVRLADIDDLEAIVRANHPLAVAVRRAAEEIVAVELAGFRAWLAARCCAPLIQALRARADAICQAEVEKTLR
ncbi:MAG: glutamyl-tRNA reductase, partial [Anaerolineae bacterium]